MSSAEPQKKTELNWEKTAPGVWVLRDSIDRDKALELMEKRRQETEMRHSGGKAPAGKRKSRWST